MAMGRTMAMALLRRSSTPLAAPRAVAPLRAAFSSKPTSESEKLFAALRETHMPYNYTPYNPWFAALAMERKLYQTELLVNRMMRGGVHNIALLALLGASLYLHYRSTCLVADMEMNRQKIKKTLNLGSK